MEQRIWTARHNVRVPVTPGQAYQLIANIENYPKMFDSVIAVERLGHDGTNERVRFWGTFGDHRGSWVSVREVNPKRMRVRFRQERSTAPLASLGGRWLVTPRGAGAEVVLDHYFRVVDDNDAAGQHLERVVARSATAMLESLRQVTQGGDAYEMWFPLSDAVRGLEGVS